MIVVEVGLGCAPGVEGPYISPELAITTHVRFNTRQGSEGRGNSGANTVATARDFGMRQDEVQNVVRVMCAAVGDVVRFNHQKTDEEPQLYWSHRLKVGVATRSPRDPRRLDHMD